MDPDFQHYVCFNQLDLGLDPNQNTKTNLLTLITINPGKRDFKQGTTVQSKRKSSILWVLILSCYLVVGCTAKPMEIPIGGKKWAQPKQETKTDQGITIILLSNNVLAGIEYSENENYHLQLNAAVIEDGSVRTFVLVPVLVHPFKSMSIPPTLFSIRPGKSLLISVDAFEFSFTRENYKPKPKIDSIEGTQPPLARAYHQANYVVSEDIFRTISSSRQVEVTILCDGLTVTGTFRGNNLSAFQEFYETNVSSKAKMAE